MGNLARFALLLVSLGALSVSGCYDKACGDACEDPEMMQADAGSQSGGDLGSGCTDSLANVGTADFSIKFRILTSSMALSTVLFQRASCDARADLWDISMTSSGHLRIGIIEAGAKYTDLTTSVFVNDGKTHEVTVRRTAQQLETLIDGTLAGSAPAPQKLGQLPPLGVSSGNPCETTGVKPFVGTITEVCLSK